MEGLHLHDASVSLRDGDRAFRVMVDDLAVAHGQAVALTGASGSGKTLLLEVLGLLRRADPGARHVVDDMDLAAAWAHRGRLAALRGRMFGFVPQTGGLLPFLDVRANVALPQRVTGREDAARVGALIDRLGLTAVAALRPGALSIGQRQRVAVARALAHRPPVVIADEPTAALDGDTASDVLALLLDTAAQDGCAVILSSHDHARIAPFGLRRVHLTSQREAGGQVISTAEEVPW
ncbi:MAG: ABC transporter [Pseudooceanicola sp.]|jgi:putative ABC transport system ATP-binding protein|nr:ABC transporter [Pseudooceanicola sp.]